MKRKDLQHITIRKQTVESQKIDNSLADTFPNCRRNRTKTNLFRRRY